jgi:hypothetical protein
MFGLWRSLLSGGTPWIIICKKESPRVTHLSRLVSALTRRRRVRQTEVYPELARRAKDESVLQKTADAVDCKARSSHLSWKAQDLELDPCC